MNVQAGMYTDYMLHIQNVIAHIQTNRNYVMLLAAQHKIPNMNVSRFYLLDVKLSCA
jgi:Tfp pilus assembly protein PilZ